MAPPVKKLLCFKREARLIIFPVCWLGLPLLPIEINPLFFFSDKHQLEPSLGCGPHAVACLSVGILPQVECHVDGRPSAAAVKRCGLPHLLETFLKGRSVT